MKKMLLMSIGGLFLMGNAYAADCDRACLEQHVSDYASALINKDPSSLKVTSNLKVSENSVAVKLGQGPSWEGITAFRSQPQFISDVQNQEVGYMGVVTSKGEPAFLALRLKINDDKISEVESILSYDGEGGPAFLPEGMIYRESPYIREVPKENRSSRQELIDVANIFWDVSTSTHDAAQVPYAVDCWHFENGMNTNWEREVSAGDSAMVQRNPEAYEAQAYDGRIWTCARETYLTTSAWKEARQRHFLVDEDRGLILTVTNVDYPPRNAGSIIPDGGQEGGQGGPGGAPGGQGGPGPQAAGGPGGAPGGQGGPGGPGGPGGARDPIQGSSGGPVGMSTKGMQAAMAGNGYTTVHFMLMRIVDGKITREQDVMHTVPYETSRIF